MSGTKEVTTINKVKGLAKRRVLRKWRSDHSVNAKWALSQWQFSTNML